MLTKIMPSLITDRNVIEFSPRRNPSPAGERRTVNSAAVKMKPEVVACPKKIWIDLENSPHVPFFKPIMEELEKRGHSIIVTARDCFQVCDLADLFHMKYQRVGRHYGKHTLAKIAGLGLRVLQMTPGMWREKPDLSISHGSRSQIVVSSLLGIPNLTIFDYEHSAWLRMFKPAWVMAPEVISQDSICAKGIPRERLLQYPGIKEDVYAPSFKPDASIKQKLGLEDADLVVTIRPPATEAHYHNPEAEGLLTAVFELLGAQPRTKIVLVPRTPKQGEDLRQQFPDMFRSKQAIIPEQVVDGLDLIWFSDLVVSGGGTMNREAAALGVPVYSIFRGKLGAVDRYLTEQGRLVMLSNVEDVKTKLKTVRRQKSNQRISGTQAPVLDSVVHSIVSILESPAQHRAQLTLSR
jgi:predicted glycosyltransferase